MKIRVQNPADDGLLNFLLDIEEANCKSIVQFEGKVFLVPCCSRHQIELTEHLKKEFARLKGKLLERVSVLPAPHKPAKGLWYV